MRMTVPELMLLELVLSLGVAFLCEGRVIAGVTPTQQYGQSEILDGDVDNVKYALFWSYNTTHVTFEVHVKTTGWVGFGLSSTGGMYPADVVIGWVTHDGNVLLSDLHTTGYVTPVRDTSQDWHLQLGMEIDGRTILKFGRKINTCDNTDDITIQQGTSRIIYAYGTSDPVSMATVDGHGQTRGTKSLALLMPASVPQNLPDNVITHDFFNPNILIPVRSTTYWCTKFHMPNIGKHHLVKYESVITVGNENYVHHMTLYRCTGLNPGPGGTCNGNRKEGGSNCNTMILPMAVGGQEFNFPDHVGFSVGDEDDGSTFVLEIHYNNPYFREGVRDSSGIRLTLTSDLRPQEAGLLQLGTVVSSDQTIPPYQEAFVTKGYCSEKCLKEGMDKSQLQEINIFAAFQHSHLLGVSLTTRHYRGGVELEPIIDEPHYDFFYQLVRSLPEERHIQQGGLSTENEMCFTIAYYYPRMPMVHCVSNLVYDRTRLHQYLVTADWTNKTTVASFEQLTQQSQVLHTCKGQGLQFVADNDKFLETDSQTAYTSAPSNCN